MRFQFRSLASLALCLALLQSVAAQTTRADEPNTTAFRGARILTAAGPIHDPGTLVVREGRIVAVGPADSTAIPDGAAIVEANGRVIIPGIVDSHSHLGVYSRPAVQANSDGNEMTGPVQSIVRALDSLNPFDPGIRMATAGGVTTANIMPGSGNVIGGQTVYVKLRGYSPEQMWIASADNLGGLKMANGENPKRSYGGRGHAPKTRMKVASLQRAEFLKAQQYRDKWNTFNKKHAEWEAQRKVATAPKPDDDAKPEDTDKGDEAEAGNEPTPPDRDLALEPLVEVLEKKRTVHFHTHRADDILTTLRLKQEFGFDLVIQHGTESYKVLDEIAKAGVPVSLTIVDSPGGKAEVVNFIEECANALHTAGIKVIVNTDDPVTESRFLLRTAAATVRGGLPADVALQAVTLHPAQAMRLDSRIGSLEPGKDADFVILSGEPFSVYTRVLETYIEGRRVFQLEDNDDRLYQTGGFAVADKSRIPAATAFVAPPAAAKAPDAPADAKAPTAESQDVLILAGRLHTVSGESLENAAILVQGGKIAAIGLKDAIAPPPGVPVVVAAHVTPGLIDAYSIVPLSGEYNIPADQDADEETDPSQPDLRALDAFHPSEPLLRFILEQGVTVVHACPGRANVIAGQTGVFRTHGQAAESMAIRFPQAVLFNLGSDVKETYKGQKPGTRMGTASLIRSALNDARNFAAKRASAKADEPIDRNLKLEPLADLLDGKLTAMFCAQRSDDLQTAIRLVHEFQLKGHLALAADGYLIRDDLKSAGLPVIVHPTMQRAEEFDLYNSYLGSAATLQESGLQIAIGTSAEGYVPKTRVLRSEAAMAMVYGLGFDKALRAVTLDAAKILGIDDRYGSLEVGKVADLVLYDGDPFEHATHVTHVIVDGQVVYDRAQRPNPTLAEMFYLSNPEIPCCLGW